MPKLEALWSVEFRSSRGVSGAGIVVLETGRVLGGDSWFTIIGEYTATQPGMLEATAQVKRFNAGSESIFGQYDQVDLKISGRTDERRMTLHGHVVGQPHLELEAILTRRAELP